MAYDEDLAERVRAALAADVGLLPEKRMFGGLAFLHGGHMAVAVSGSGGLLLRCAPEDTETHRTQPGIEPMVMQGKQMTGWLHVLPEAVDDEESLVRWVAVGTTYTASLTPKQGA